MNPVIIGQVSETAQNNLNQRPDRSSKEGAQRDSFETVFAEASASSDTEESVQVEEPTSLDSEISVEERDQETDSEDVAEDVESERVAQDAEGSELVEAVQETQLQSSTPDDTEASDVLPWNAEGEEDTTEAEASGTPVIIGSESEQDEAVPVLAGATSADTSQAEKQPNSQKIGEVAETDGRFVESDQRSDSTQTLIAGQGRAGKTSEPVQGTATVAHVDQAKTAGASSTDPTEGLTLHAADSVEELPLVYQVRLGALPTTAQKAVQQNVPGVAAPTTSVSPVAMQIQQGLAQTAIDDVDTAQDATLVEDMDVQIESEIEWTANNATRAAATPTSTDAIKTVLPQPSSVPNAPIRQTAADQRSADDIEIPDLATDRMIRADAISTSAVQSTAPLSNSTAASQTTLVSQFGQLVKQDLSKPDIAVETRFAQEAIGISQALTEAMVRSPVPQGREIVQRIATQLGEAFATKGERKVDVMLNPKELGNVKMQLATSDAGVRVMIVAERAETGDLMRRHITELEREFKEMGFENISFQFSGGNAQSQSGDGNPERASGRQSNEVLAEVEDAPADIKQQLNLGGSGLDMRV